MKRHWIARAAVLLIVASGGFLIGRGTKAPHDPRPAAHHPGDSGGLLYTCSMHPQVRLDRPGKCPICEMPLIPAASASSSTGEPPMLQLSEHAMAMASVETTPVTRRALTRNLRAVGKIQYNESSLATITARVDGYAERLFVDFTGVEVKVGDHLAEVYSPELLVAQQELLIAIQRGTSEPDDPLVETAKLKLERWGLTKEQILDLVASRRITERVTLYSPIQGTVIEKSIFENSAFEAGDALYRIADLDTVWVYLDIYEYDLAWVRYGQRVELTAEALPGRSFEGLVTFVQPIVDDETRTVRVPVHIENEDHALKPGMFVSAVLRSALAADGSAAPTGVEGKFSCPMHPQVLRDEIGPCPICEMRLERIPGDPVTHGEAARGPGTQLQSRHACPMKCESSKTYAEPGDCPVCGMRLEPVRAESPPPEDKSLAVPASAVLDSGTRHIVYVERSRGLFEPREVVLGPRAGPFFPVLRGLIEGEHVVTRGGFLIDSQFQITGHPSLFHPGGLMAGDAGHRHGAGPTTESPPGTAKPEPTGKHEH